MRAQIANMVTGRHDGLQQDAGDRRHRLPRATMDGKKLVLQLGFSPSGPSSIRRRASRSRSRTRRASTISGADKALVGQVAGGHPRLPSARALQGQGRQVRGRVHPPQGRQGSGSGVHERVDITTSTSGARSAAIAFRSASRARTQRPRLSRVPQLMRTSTPRSSTTSKGVDAGSGLEPRRREVAGRRQGQGRRSSAAVGKLLARARSRQGRQRRRVRSRRLSLPRARQGARRRRTRRRTRF